MEFDIPSRDPIMISLATRISNGVSQGNVNMEERSIKDVIMMQVGEAKGYGYEIEPSFLADTLKFIKKSMNGRVQSNMGHRWDANFFQLGRFDNVRIINDGKTMVGDQTIYAAADKSPVMEGMASWYMGIAEEDPQAVMCSINGRLAGIYQYDDKGNKVYLQYEWWMNEPKKIYPNRPAFAQFKSLTSCDIVESGALTDSLFSEGGSTEIAQQVARLMKSPGFMEFFRHNEEIFPELQAHFQHKYKFSLPKLLTNLFSNNKVDMEDPQVTTTPITASVPTPADPPAPNDVNALIAAALKPLQDEIAGMKTSMDAKDAEIATLKAAPAATLTSVKSDGPSRTDASEVKLWEKDPINIKARGFKTAAS